ncbi:MAG: lytic transglycosylase domain-containing protein [Pseudomonadota bacterium]
MVTNDDLRRLLLLESRGDPRAVNAKSGAQGLMQVMPATGRQPGFGVSPIGDPFDPQESIRFGRDYFGQMLSRYDGNKRRALAAYNWGPGNADEWDGDLDSLPEETRNYILSFEADTDQKGNPWTEEQLATARGFLGDDGADQSANLHFDTRLQAGDDLPTVEIQQAQRLAEQLGIGGQNRVDYAQLVEAAKAAREEPDSMLSLIANPNGEGVRMAREALPGPSRQPQQQLKQQFAPASQSGGGWGRAEIGLTLQALGEGLSAISQRRPADMRGIQRQIEARRQREAAGKARNKTMEFLSKRGMNDIAALAEAGAISPNDALSFALRTPADERTALIKNFEFARSQGYEGGFQQFMRDSRSGTTVNVGSEGQRLGTIPPGYSAVQDPANAAGYRFEAVPGGPVDAERSATAETEQLGQQVGAEKFARLQGDIDRAIGLARDGYATGAFSLLAGIPIPSDARSLRNLVDTLKANLGFEAIQTMREASPTGGALGQVTERELGFLQSTIANLDTGAGEEELIRQLNKVSGHLTTLRDISQGTYQIPLPGAPVTIDGVTIEEIR